MIQKISLQLKFQQIITQLLIIFLRTTNFISISAHVVNTIQNIFDNLGRIGTFPKT